MTCTCGRVGWVGRYFREFTENLPDSEGDFSQCEGA